MSCEPCNLIDFLDPLFVIQDKYRNDGKNSGDDCDRPVARGRHATAVTAAHVTLIVEGIVEEVV